MKQDGAAQHGILMWVTTFIAVLTFYILSVPWLLTPALAGGDTAMKLYDWYASPCGWIVQHTHLGPLFQDYAAWCLGIDRPGPGADNLE